MAVVLGLLIFNLIIPSRGAQEAAAPAQGFMKSVTDLASADPAVSRQAVARLVQARSHEEITSILRALDTAAPTVRNQLLKVLGDIGEPAADEVFSGSVPSAEGDLPPFPYASHALTNFIELSAIPVLVDKVRSGSTEERKVAAWALWYITRYAGIGGHEPTGIISALASAATTDPLDYVKDYSANALCNIKHDACIPALVKLLADERARPKACAGLVKFGARAAVATDILRNGIEQRIFPAEALDALMSIEGEAAVPFVVASLTPWRYQRNDRDTICMALLRHPHPAAMPFMEEELWGDPYSSRGCAAQFFAALDNPCALENLRRCLALVAVGGKSERINPLDTDVSGADTIRVIAATYLVSHKDTGSYATILRMLREDLSKRVRITAAKAFGEIGWAEAVPALSACLEEPDDANLYANLQQGDLHAAAVQALGRIGTPEAHAALYNGLAKDRAPLACARFWLESREPEVFEKFLGFYRQSPVDDKLAARIISNHLRPYSLPKAQAANARESFLATVRDPARFGAAVDLTEAGKWQLEITYEFFTIEFAHISFTFRSPQREHHEHGESILYRKQEAGWRPMGTISGWTE